MLRCAGLCGWMMIVVGWLGAPLPLLAADAAERLKLLQVFQQEFLPVTPGEGKFPASFTLGTPNGPFTELPARKVTLTAPFALARYEVPQNLWEAVMGSNPSKWKGPRNSAEMFTWGEAVEFCRKATTLLREAQLLAADEEIRLPTEIEWEYCCRAGTTTPYSFGESATAPGDTGNKASLLDVYGWHTGNAAGNDPPVGAKQANPWGFHDMHGYLREFTADEWRENHDPATPGTPRRRTIRGGSWKDRHECLRSAYREPIAEEARDDAVGLRCVRAKVRPAAAQ